MCIFLYTTGVYRVDAYAYSAEGTGSCPLDEESDFAVWASHPAENCVLASFLAGILSEQEVFIIMKKRSQTLYPHPFSLSYWKDAATECKSPRSLAHAAFLCALAIVIEKFNIPLSPYLQISLSFFAVALCSMLTGPVLAVACGVIVDLIGAIGSPYPFFFGYTLTAILTAVVYALFLYRGKVTYFRVQWAEILINFVINAFLGSFWRVVLYHGAFWVYFSLAMAKNLVLLAPEAFVLCAFLRVMTPPLKQIGILPAETEVKYGKGSLIFALVSAVLGGILVALLAVYYPQVKEFLTEAFS